MGERVEISGWAWRGGARPGLVVRSSTHCGEESPQKSGMALKCRTVRCPARPGKHTALQGEQKFAAERGSAKPCLAWRDQVKSGKANTQHPNGVLKFADNTNNERKNQWKTQ